MNRNLYGVPQGLVVPPTAMPLSGLVDHIYRKRDAERVVFVRDFRRHG